MPAASNLRDHLMAYIGLPIGSTLPQADHYAILAAANAALYELLGTGERRQERRAELVRAPEDVTLGAVTANSKALTFSGYASYMKGCTIKIGDIYNRLVNTNGTVSLEAPYTGSTATNVAATVYFDCVTLDNSYDNVVLPVMLDEQYKLELVPNLNELTTLRAARSALPTPATGLPSYALMEDSLTESSTPATRFLFDSLPLQRYVLSFLASIRPPQISVWSDATPFFLPGMRDPLVLYPVARFHLRGYEGFKGNVDVAEKDYQLAMQHWKAFKNKGPQPGVLDIHG